MPLTEARKEFYRKRIEMYLEAEEMILRGQSYRIGSRSLTRADLSAVQREIHRIENLIDSGGSRFRAFRFVLRDL